jgi:hypothetical protein
MNSVSSISQPRLANPAKAWFYWFAGLHATLWVLVPTVFYYNTFFDIAENISLGRQWQLGYSKYPPLVQWLTAWLYNLTGSSEFPIYILSQVSIFTCFWVVWRLGRQVLQPAQAMVGVLLLEGIYYFSLYSPTFNQNIVLLPLTALSVYFFYQAIQRQKILHWALVGLFMGLALLTKYQALLLTFTFIMTLCGHPKARVSWSKPGVYVSALLTFLLVLPHLVWLWQHDFVSFEYIAETIYSAGYHPIRYALRFLGEQGLAILPLFLLFILFRYAPRSSESVLEFDRYFLSLMAWGPAMFALLLALFFGMRIYSLWCVPFFMWLGLWVVATFNPQIYKNRFMLFAGSVLLLMITTASIRVITVYYGPAWYSYQNQAHFPGKDIAKHLTEEWHTRYNQPLAYIAGEWALVGNISVYSPDSPAPYYDAKPEHNVWVSAEDLKTKGMLIVWTLAPGQAAVLPPEIALRYPTAILVGMREFPYHTRATLPPLRLGVAVLEPASYLTKRPALTQQESEGWDDGEDDEQG